MSVGERECVCVEDRVSVCVGEREGGCMRVRQRERKTTTTLYSTALFSVIFIFFSPSSCHNFFKASHFLWCAYISMIFAIVIIKNTNVLFTVTIMVRHTFSLTTKIGRERASWKRKIFGNGNKK